MRVLVAAIGSHGDVLPFLAIARELARRGHDVRFFASAHFEREIRDAGLEGVLLGTADDYVRIVRHPDAFHPRRGMKVILGAALEGTPDFYRILERHVRPGDTAVVWSSLAFAARLLVERRGLPGAVLHLSPSIFRSTTKPPVLGDPTLPSWLPAAAVRAVWYAVDRWMADPLVCPSLNRFRAELDLPPVRRVFQDWIHGGRLVLGLFPSWFAEPQPDWPAHAHVTGFPLYDRDDARLPDDVEAFLDDGAAPVVFTSGTAVALEHGFFETSVEACRRTGRRGLLLTRYPEQVPALLPEGVRHVAWAPFGSLLPRAAAVVHHGGIGTTAQALRAGVPQLVRPLAFDQFDNAARLVNLGVARILRANHYTADTLAAVLDDIDRQAEVTERCRRAAERLAHDNGIVATVDRLAEAGITS